MQGRVCIVLNERESLKSRIAENLASALLERNITPFRIPIDDQLFAAVRSNSPHIVVLDYLLGDHGSGLDLMAELGTLPTHQRPTIIFLTDEPGVQVAASAIKLGAKAYIEIEHPKAVAKAVEQVENVLVNLELSALSARPAQIPLLSDLIFESKSSTDLPRRYASLYSAQVRAAVVYGECGSGKSTLARAAHHSQTLSGALIEVDLTLLTDSLESFLSNYLYPPGLQRLPQYSTLIVENAQEDNGELLSIFSTRELAKLYQRSNTIPTIILNYTDQSKANALAEKLELDFIHLPNLTERPEDIAPLTQYFLRCCAESQSSKQSARFVSMLQSEDLLWLRDQPSWPGNLRELRAVVTEAAMKLLESKDSCQELLAESKGLFEQWHKNPANQGETIPPLAVSLWYHRMNGDIRRVAAKLGVSQEAINSSLANSVPSLGQFK